MKLQIKQGETWLQAVFIGKRLIVINQCAEAKFILIMPRLSKCNLSLQYFFYFCHWALLLID